MQRHNGIIFMFSILVITALACNLPSVTPTPSIDADATLTSLALTQDGQSPPTDLPIFTPTITLTPTLTLTLPPSVPMVSVSVDTNCRTGPGVIYDYLTGLSVGEKAEVIGKFLVLGRHHGERGVSGYPVDVDPVPVLLLSFRQRPLQHDRGCRRRQPAQHDNRHEADQQQAGDSQQQELPQALQAICASGVPSPSFRAFFPCRCAHTR